MMTWSSTRVGCPRSVVSFSRLQHNPKQTSLTLPPRSFCVEPSSMNFGDQVHSLYGSSIQATCNMLRVYVQSRCVGYYPPRLLPIRSILSITIKDAVRHETWSVSHLSEFLTLYLAQFLYTRRSLILRSRPVVLIQSRYHHQRRPSSTKQSRRISTYHEQCHHLYRR